MWENERFSSGPEMKDPGNAHFKKKLAAFLFQTSIYGKSAIVSCAPLLERMAYKWTKQAFLG